MGDVGAGVRSASAGAGASSASAGTGASASGAGVRDAGMGGAGKVSGVGADAGSSGAAGAGASGAAAEKAGGGVTGAARAGTGIGTAGTPLTRTAELRTKEVDDLLEVLATLDDPNTIFALLEDLFTIREIKDTSQRLAVARLLDEGKSYSLIERETGASATTIARVSKCLGYGAGGYKAALDALSHT